jgi:FKBP-type peptidyl-prolyl cis-trans isomerase
VKLSFKKLSVLCLSAAAFAASGVMAAPSSSMKDLSYTMGYRFAATMHHFKVAINSSDYMQGFKAGLQGKNSRLSNAAMTKILATFQQNMQKKAQKMMQKQSNSNAQAGELFLAKNKTKKGVVTLANGLQYKVLVQGHGPKPKLTDKVTVDYEGKLINGQVFDSSYARHQPTSFALNGVIPGWTQALQLMPVGSTWMLYIPSKLAYGARGMPGIGPNSTLIFKVHLIKIGK